MKLRTNKSAMQRIGITGEENVLMVFGSLLQLTEIERASVRVMHKLINKKRRI